MQKTITDSSKVQCLILKWKKKKLETRQKIQMELSVIKYTNGKYAHEKCLALLSTN